MVGWRVASERLGLEAEGRRQFQRRAAVANENDAWSDRDKAASL